MHMCELKSSYGKSDMYCRVCGMDIGLAPVKKKNGKVVLYYCCEGCADAGKEG